jgi:transcriptional regulator with XRE-family HTH domain
MAVKKKKKEPVRLNRLKVVLVEKNISQTELAAMVNRDRNSISRICNNITQPSLKLLYEIAFAINIDVRSILMPKEEIKEAFLKEKGE